MVEALPWGLEWPYLSPTGALTGGETLSGNLCCLAGAGVSLTGNGRASPDGNGDGGFGIRDGVRARRLRFREFVPFFESPLGVRRGVRALVLELAGLTGDGVRTPCKRSRRGVEGGLGINEDLTSEECVRAVIRPELRLERGVLSLEEEISLFFTS